MARHLVWDWNGTLLDDLTLCVNATNTCLAMFGGPQITAEDHRRDFRRPVVDYYSFVLGRPVDADYEVTELVADRVIAFQAVAGPVRPAGRYTLEALGDATALTFHLDADLRGWKRFVMGRIVQSTMDAEMAALDNLRDVLER